MLLLLLRGINVLPPQNMSFGIFILLCVKRVKRNFNPLPASRNSGRKTCWKEDSITVTSPHKQTGRPGEICQSRFVGLPSVPHRFWVTQQEFLNPMFALSHLPVNNLFSLWNPRPRPPSPLAKAAPTHRLPNVSSALTHVWHHWVYIRNKFWTFSQATLIITPARKLRWEENYFLPRPPQRILKIHARFH